MTKEMKQRLERFVRLHEIQRFQTYFVFYKAVKRNYDSPIQPNPLRFNPYRDVTVPKVNTDPRWDCGDGIHVGTKNCAMAHIQARRADRLMRVLVRPQDVACISDDTISALRRDVTRHKLRVSALFVVDDVLRRREGKLLIQERPLEALVTIV